MTILGIDFDNTIVSYDQTFYELALSKSLINKEFPIDKNKIRDYLVSKGLEDQFTLMQGAVYGKYIINAKPCLGVYSSIKKIKEMGIEIFIISHKTKYPYAGERYDLHHAARSWLKKNRFTEKDGLDIKEENIFFEKEIEKKVERIKAIKCHYYVDDLLKVLNLIDPSIGRIHYYPNGNYNRLDYKNIRIFRTWGEIERVFIN